MRVAIYYTPPAEHPLARAAVHWLGRDAFTGGRLASAATEAIGAEELQTFTAEPSRYGFHATIKAPFRLAEGRTLDDLQSALAAFCEGREPVPLGRLQIADFGQFIALVPCSISAELHELAAEVVRVFDTFRAPLTQGEMARRQAGFLSPRQEAHLLRWGYPHVFEDFRFHMTLASRISEEGRPSVISLLEERFKHLLETVPNVDSLALFVEPEPGADFDVLRRIGFGS